MTAWERRIREKHGGLERVLELDKRFKELREVHKKSKAQLERGYRDVEKLRDNLEQSLGQERILKEEIRKLEHLDAALEKEL